MTEPTEPSVEGRSPPPPEALLDWTRRFTGAETLMEGPSLLASARVALHEAMARPGRNRDGAFALLVGDALLTWASEDAADETDPANALGRAMDVVAGLIDDPSTQDGRAEG